MKPFLEKISPSEGASWSILRVAREPTIPFEWHHHPEYELTLTTNSRGHRFIGDHVGPYDDGDLVLLGPNLPHSWASTAKLDLSQPHNVRVIQFRPDWASGLTGLLTELASIDALLTRAAGGLRFSDRAAARARPVIEDIFEKDPAHRLLDLIGVMLTLAADTEAEPLATSDSAPIPPYPHGNRIDRVLEYVHAHYREDIRVETLARIAALSPTAFHRMFLRHTRQTLVTYVKRLRIGAACASLISDDLPIALVAEASGYRSLANFNRQFRELRGQTPREYRNRFRQ